MPMVFVPPLACDPVEVVVDVLDCEPLFEHAASSAASAAAAKRRRFLNVSSLLEKCLELGLLLADPGAFVLHNRNSKGCGVCGKVRRLRRLRAPRCSK